MKGGSCLRCDGDVLAILNQMLQSEHNVSVPDLTEIAFEEIGILCR